MRTKEIQFFHVAFAKTSAVRLHTCHEISSYFSHGAAQMPVAHDYATDFPDSNI